LPGKDLAVLDTMMLPAHKPLPTIHSRKTTGGDRKSWPREILRRLSETAAGDIENSLIEKKCPSYDTTLVLKAVCPKESSRLLARLARGEADSDDSRHAIESMQSSIASWIKDFT